MGADKMLVKPMHTRVLLEQMEKLLASHERKLAKWRCCSKALTAPKTARAKKLPRRSGSGKEDGRAKRRLRKPAAKKALGQESAAKKTAHESGSARTCDLAGAVSLDVVAQGAG